jgi:hypothetical protein
MRCHAHDIICLLPAARLPYCVALADPASGRLGNTIKAMEQRGLISPGKGRNALTIAWHLKKKVN